MWVRNADPCNQREERRYPVHEGATRSCGAVPHAVRCHKARSSRVGWARRHMQFREDKHTTARVPERQIFAILPAGACEENHVNG